MGMIAKFTCILFSHGVGVLSRAALTGSQGSLEGSSQKSGSYKSSSSRCSKKSSASSTQAGSVEERHENLLQKKKEASKPRRTERKLQRFDIDSYVTVKGYFGPEKYLNGLQGQIIEVTNNDTWLVQIDAAQDMNDKAREKMEENKFVAEFSPSMLKLTEE